MDFKRDEWEKKFSELNEQHMKQLGSLNPNERILAETCYKLQCLPSYLCNNEAQVLKKQLVATCEAEEKAKLIKAQQQILGAYHSLTHQTKSTAEEACKLWQINLLERKKNMSQHNFFTCPPGAQQSTSFPSPAVSASTSSSVLQPSPASVEHNVPPQKKSLSYEDLLSHLKQKEIQRPISAIRAFTKKQVKWPENLNTEPPCQKPCDLELCENQISWPYFWRERECKIKPIAKRKQEAYKFIQDWCAEQAHKQNPLCTQPKERFHFLLQK